MELILEGNLLARITEALIKRDSWTGFWAQNLSLEFSIPPYSLWILPSTVQALVMAPRDSSWL